MVGLWDSNTGSYCNIEPWFTSIVKRDCSIIGVVGNGGCILSCKDSLSTAWIWAGIWLIMKCSCLF